MHRRVHIRELKLIRGQRTIRCHVPLAQQEQQLVLGKVRVDARHRHHVKGGVPRSEPRVFPSIRHGQDIARVHVAPVAVTPAQAVVRWTRLIFVALQPTVDSVVIELLGPKQSRVGLAHNGALLSAQYAGLVLPIEAIVLCLSRLPFTLKANAKGRTLAAACGPQAQRQRAGLARLQAQTHPPCSLRTHKRGIDRGRASMHDTFVESVLDIGRRVGNAPQTLEIRVVFRVELLDLTIAYALQTPLERAQTGLIDGDTPCIRASQPRPQITALFRAPPRPGVAKPQRGQHV